MTAPGENSAADAGGDGAPPSNCPPQHASCLEGAAKPRSEPKALLLGRRRRRYQPTGAEVVDGLHRVEEARRRGETTISAVIREGTATEALLQNLVLNRVRGKVKASEMVAVIGALWKDHGMDSDQIG